MNRRKSDYDAEQRIAQGERRRSRAQKSASGNGTVNLRSGNDHGVAYEAAERSLGDYIEILLRKKWIVIVAFAVSVALSAVYALTATPIYRSEATIEVGDQRADSLKSVGESPDKHAPQQTEVYATEAEILKSRSLSEALIVNMELDRHPSFTTPARTGLIKSTMQLVRSMVSSSQSGRARMSPAEAKREGLIRNVQSRIAAKRRGKSRLIVVSMEASDPLLAQDLLDNYVAIYLDQNLRKRRRANLDANAWISAELDKIEKKLMSSISDLVGFTNDHGIVSLGEQGNHVITFFEKAAEGLVKSKEQRVQVEAFAGNSGKKEVAYLPTEIARPDFKRLQEKLTLMESRFSELRGIYSDKYPRVIMLRRQIESLRSKLATMEEGAVSAALDTAKQQERMHQKAFDQAKKDAMNINSLGVQYAVLKKEVETNEELYRILLKKSKEMQLNTEIIGNNVTLIDAPTIPTAPVRPRKGLLLAVGTLIGLLSGVGLAVFLDQMDDKIRTTHDVESKLSLPNLGVVPDASKLNGTFGKNGGNGAYEFLPYSEPKSLAAEAISNVKTSLFLSVASDPIKGLVVSSAVPSEGKTYIAVSIATAVSSTRKRVLIVDTDLRRPRVASLFGHSNVSHGLSTLLTKRNVKLREVIRRSKVPGLHYLPAGPVPPNPVRLLESQRMLGVMEKLESVFDLVIYDSPPIVGFSDAQILTANTDGIILVIREGHVPLEILKRSTELMSLNQDKILGVVLNKARSGGFSYYRGYKYYSAYGYGKYYSSS